MYQSYKYVPIIHIILIDTKIFMVSFLQHMGIHPVLKQGKPQALLQLFLPQSMLFWHHASFNQI
jgi:hypothetical protein